MSQTHARMRNPHKFKVNYHLNEKRSKKPQFDTEKKRPIKLESCVNFYCFSSYGTFIVNDSRKKTGFL